MKPATHFQGDSFTDSMSTSETPSQGTLEDGHEQTSRFTYSRFKHVNQRGQLPVNRLPCVDYK